MSAMLLIKRNSIVDAALVFLIFRCCTGPILCQNCPDATNSSPSVSITWPHWGDRIVVETFIKIKANAADPNGIAQVQFFVETNLIGIVTNAPFNFVWYVGDGVPLGIGSGHWTLKAVAINSLGVRTESAPVKISYSPTLPPFPVVEMVSPRNGALLPAPATFAFSAELLVRLKPRK